MRASASGKRSVHSAAAVRVLRISCVTRWCARDSASDRRRWATPAPPTVPVPVTETMESGAPARGAGPRRRITGRPIRRLASGERDDQSVPHPAMNKMPSDSSSRRRDRARRGHAPCRHRARAGPPPPRPAQREFEGERRQRPGASMSPSRRTRVASCAVERWNSRCGARGIPAARSRPGSRAMRLRDQHADRRHRPVRPADAPGGRGIPGGREGPTRDAACRRRNCAGTRHVRFATRSQRHTQRVNQCFACDDPRRTGS